MGKEAEHIFKSLQFAENGDEKKFEKVFEKFDEYFIPKRNIIHERARFHQRAQQPGESIETFVRNLHEISEYCDFADKKEQIRDRLVIGISDKELSEKLQLRSDLTLEKAVEIARQSEMVKSQIKDQSVSATNVEAVRKHSVMGQSQRNFNTSRGRGRGHRSSGGRGRGNHHGAGQSQGKCSKCNLRHSRDHCFAKGKQCRRCHKYDHFAVCCNQNSVAEIVQPKLGGLYEETGFLGSVTTCHDDEAAWKVNLRICGKTVTFKIDSGADTSVMGKSTYRTLQYLPKLKSANTALFGPGGRIDCLGVFTAETNFKDQNFVFPIHVIEGTSNLLGRSAAHKFGLIKKIDNVESSLFGSFGLVKCEPVRITLKDGAKPYCLTTARRIAFPLMAKVEAELNRLEKEGIIEKVERPTDWCAPMVPVLKKNGNVRICVDLKKLNEAVKREHFMLPNLDDISPRLAGSTLFSKLDASSGFYQIPLHPDSCGLTTFITPMGRYCFRRVPFGITSAPEIFQRKMTELLHGIEGVEVIIDDILIHGKTRKEHDLRLDTVLHRIHDSGLKLNREKCEFRKTEIEYFGHSISSEGIRPSSSRVDAIRQMETPTNLTELRRFIGMVNYLGRFIPELASVISPMTDLLKSGSAWLWDQAQANAFSHVKQLLTCAPVLTFYDPQKPIVVSADASSFGLGAALFQQEGDVFKPVAYCSRKLTSAELKYAQIEKECLASLWACEKFSRYIVGLKSFKLLTDHKPLVPLINTQDLDKAPLRCQRMLMRLRGYSLHAEHVPGKHLIVPDTLSRSPIGRPNQGDTLAEEVECYVDLLENSRPLSDKLLEQIQQATEGDSILQEAINHTRHGWPTHMNSIYRRELRDYFVTRSELSESRGLLLYRNRIVIPETLRSEVLRSIHDGHLGLNKCRARAQDSVWWPGITQDIRNLINTCEFCQTHRRSQQREPLKYTPLPSRPWQKIAADLCELDGKHFLVVIDYFSRFIEIAFLQSTTSAQVIGKMKNMFARWGIPEELVSDNGTQFTSETFHEFAVNYKFCQTFTSPHYPQSNGEAESAVKIAKRILRQDDIFKALLSYRNTPIEATGKSPAELMMGRKLRTTVPTLPEWLEPEWMDRDEVFLRDLRYKERYKSGYDQHHNVRPLAELKPGDSVRIKTDKDKLWVTQGTVQEADPKTRSYVVGTPRGSYRRNRRHLQKTDRSVFSDRYSKPVVPADTFISDADQEPQVISKESQSQEPKATSDVPLTPQSPKQGVIQTRSGRVVQRPKNLDDYVE